VVERAQRFRGRIRGRTATRARRAVRLEHPGAAVGVVRRFSGGAVRPQHALRFNLRGINDGTHGQ